MLDKNYFSLGVITTGNIINPTVVLTLKSSEFGIFHGRRVKTG